MYALVGPTCTYKSGIAIELAKKFPFEIVSADSRLIYKEMDIGTSKPTNDEMKEVPHHMINLVNPGEDYSAGLYKKESEEKINNIFSRDKIPLFAGGTGLYLNSVLLGLSIPEVKPDLSLRRQLKELTQKELYENLKKLDPKATEIIHTNDNFRTIRALEVIYKTNELFSKLKTVKELPFKVIWIGLTYKERELHVKKIKKRSETFFKTGFIDEVKYLLGKYGELDLFKQTIGYSEVIEYLKNQIDKDSLAEKITLNTRGLVKRQMTWFRSNKQIQWEYLDDIDYKDALERVFSLIEKGSLAKTSKVSIS
ncbi:MAG: tRNA (adenosine(37)-N6)-dimethylallyltransferase MiaA [Candidatus Melainabacteria bacterium RIFCSPLOWO2_02_FULL_35_15]|nr:MAG: tRNA (adenosine(37)-N6)-dimethylallyltransferase MiaA [Candidatus Melainabacteria bacterium RIFCSPLOWO2_12_FULL_35_11]OGI14246.1 MAG: tRNA (adenosine(37)-N6)-dimethylallyltransferase MiaA [Candidatus Melainabacteria bacterium RIFCSPLOWO2_02_FULL_35_15]